jgi:tRNA nucleotidyltransferase (CCA-adding enzyme)
MQVYLVGGAVRDRLLGRVVTERDWVVVGATPQQMLRQGYQAVGKDFPVFLHPKTKEEYALARTERKSGHGYHGFTFDTSTEVTLEQDLARRDLTINAIAQDAQEQLIDPYGGVQDLQAKILRHVSLAFAEDPLRILRVARFAARFATLGFQIAEETLQLMRQMVQAGEVNYLVPDRVWLEWQKVLADGAPKVFLQALNECGALSILFSQFSKLVDDATRTSVFAVVTKLVEQQAANQVRFAALCGECTVNEVNELCQHYPVPKAYRKLALICAEYLPVCQTTAYFTEETVLQLLLAQDALRQPDRLNDFLAIADSYYQVRQQTTKIWPGRALLEQVLQALQKMDLRHIAEQYKGTELKQAVQQRRLTCVTQILQQWRQNHH